MPGPVAVILAAGQGTRMRSDTPKMLHEICGLPMILWPVRAALRAGAERVIVVGGADRARGAALPAGVGLAVQHEPRGTGDAVRAGAPDQLGPETAVLVLNGDVPLITADALRALLDGHERSGARATLMTTVLDDPSGYGRVVRAPDGTVARVVETKVLADATADELAIHEVNAGIYAFAAGPLSDAHERLSSDNAQGEEYLPDVLPHLAPVRAHEAADTTVTLGVNDRVELAAVTRLAQA